MSDTENKPISSFDILEKKRKHVRVYHPAIPDKKIIEECLWKAWKSTPGKNNCMPYRVDVYGPNNAKEKQSIYELCWQNHKDAEQRAVDFGLNDKTQGGMQNPDYAHIKNNAYLFAFHSRVLKKLNPYYVKQVKKGHFADQMFPHLVERIVDSVAVEVGLFAQNLSIYLLEKDIDISYTSCFKRSVAEWHKKGLNHVEYRPILLMSCGIAARTRRDFLRERKVEHEDIKPDIEDIVKWI